VKGAWEELERPGRDVVEIDGVEVRVGSGVRLRPSSTVDVFDRALAGREAIVESLETDLDDNVQLVVIVSDDPGRDLGARRQPGHRFFFSPAEVEPLGAPPPGAKRILVAGIGNVFLGDDGFGCALAARLAARELPAGVDVVDYGIRGMDLAYALDDGWDAVVFLDATPRGSAPGSLYVIEPEIDPDALALETHGMDPVKVLAMAQAFGSTLPRVVVVGCEPRSVEEGFNDLSEPVRLALDEATTLVDDLLGELIREEVRP
jgi:hydrogenase maturation protease